MVQKYLDAIRGPRESIKRAEESISQARRELDKYCRDGVRQLLESGYKGELNLAHDPDGFSYWLKDGKLFCSLKNEFHGQEIALVNFYPGVFDEPTILNVIYKIEDALRKHTRQSRPPTA